MSDDTVSIPPCIMSLQAAIIASRPRSMIQFSIRFLQDEKNASSNPSLLFILHAIHMLPFMITQPEEFRDMACLIFCAQQNQQLYLLTSGNAVNATATAAQLLNGNKIFREYLDGSQVMEVIQLMDLPSIGLQYAAVDEILYERFDSLKRVDFNLFLSCLRIFLSLHQSICWLKDEILDSLFILDNAGSVVFPLPEDFNIDLAKFKIAILRKANSNNSTASSPQRSSGRISLLPNNNKNDNNNNNTTTSTGGLVMARQGPNISHNYHHHGYGLSEERDTILWRRVVLSALEEEKAGSMSSALLIDRFVKTLLKDSNK